MNVSARLGNEIVEARDLWLLKAKMRSCMGCGIRHPSALRFAALSTQKAHQPSGSVFLSFHESVFCETVPEGHSAKALQKARAFTLQLKLLATTLG